VCRNPLRVSRTLLRRALLARLGLLAWRGGRGLQGEGAPWREVHRGPEGAARALRQLEAVQLDPVAVIERNHHLVLWNRGRRLRSSAPGGPLPPAPALRVLGAGALPSPLGGLPCVCGPPTAAGGGRPAAKGGRGAGAGPARLEGAPPCARPGLGRAGGGGVGILPEGHIPRPGDALGRQRGGGGLPPGGGAVLRPGRALAPAGTAWTSSGRVGPGAQVPAGLRGGGPAGSPLWLAADASR